MQAKPDLENDSQPRGVAYFFAIAHALDSTATAFLENRKAMQSRRPVQVWSHDCAVAYSSGSLDMRAANLRSPVV